MLLFLLLAPAALARHTSMFKCLPLRGRNIEKLRSLFARSMVDFSCFTRVRTCRDDTGTKTFENPNDRTKSLKLVQYIISDERVHAEFNWKRLFLQQLAKRGELAFRVVFFREMRRGYIAYFRKDEYLQWHTALRHMGMDEFGQYQLNLIALFRAYESAGAVFAHDSVSSFAMDAREPARPVVIGFEDVRRLGGEFYAARQDVRVAQKVGEAVTRADRSPRQFEFYHARATAQWHAFSLLGVVCSLFHEYAFLQEQRESAPDPKSAFSAVAERLAAYDLKVQQGKSERPSIDAIESILRGLAPR